MTNNPMRWTMFEAETLGPLNTDEISEIEAACIAFNEHFNSVLDKHSQYQWNASPCNLSDLDYDFYEFGGNHWDRDDGYGFTCAWGQILVTSFGFQWMKMDGARNLSDYILKHEDASYLFFPWQTLWSIVESGGNQFEKAVGAWMRILNDVDAVYGIPTGWHIITDALRGDVSWVPKRVVTEMRAIYDRPDWCFETLGTYPYGWDKKTDWEQVRDHLKAKLFEMDSYQNDE